MHQSGEAMQAFVSTHDLLRCLGDQTDSTHDLYSLCRVSRSVHLAIAPRLYRNLDLGPNSLVDDESEEPVDRYPVQDNPHTRYARSVSTRGIRHLKALIKVLRQASNLETLRCISVGPRTFTSFSGPPTEREPWEWWRSEEDEAWSEVFLEIGRAIQLEGRVDLETYQNHIPDEHLLSQAPSPTTTFRATRDPATVLSWPKWRDTIVGILLQTPNLKTLVLGIHQVVQHKGYRFRVDKEHRASFMDLCKAYRQRAGGDSPALKLKALAVYCDEEVWSNNGCYWTDSPMYWLALASGLVDFAGLEFLRLGEDGYCEYLDQLKQSTVPNLKLLVVPRLLSRGVGRWLRHLEPGFARQIGLTYDEPAQCSHCATRVMLLDWGVYEPRMIRVRLDIERPTVDDYLILRSLLSSVGSTLEFLHLELPFEPSRPRDSKSDGVDGKALETLVSKLGKLRELYLDLSDWPDESPVKFLSQEMQPVVTAKLGKTHANLRYIHFGNVGFYILRDEDGKFCGIRQARTTRRVAPWVRVAHGNGMADFSLLLE
ncbi:hypothetical protein B0T16DRAFT_463291 [Cercophora newfieldiana]|uniref:Uncharacterized protein n=1 Tax=Cercophora newfieldiana TaxID=92897 RepID=A0AA39XTQ8_9PEZI|nr:hypothetical protein B0T16DRAFT_463291 [Cercophora newfieldiana]